MSTAFFFFMLNKFNKMTDFIFKEADFLNISLVLILMSSSCLSMFDSLKLCSYNHLRSS